MTRVTQKHWSADYRWWLLIGALLAGLVWLVNQSTETQSAASPGALRSFELKAEQLPNDWSINYNSVDMIGLSQAEANSCYVDISRRMLAGETDAVELEAEIIRDNRESIENDRYTFQDLGRGEMTVQTSGGTTSLPSYEYATDWLEGEVHSRQSVAVVINDDSYMTVNLSCPTDDLAAAQSALQAVEFGG